MAKLYQNKIDVYTISLWATAVSLTYCLPAIFFSTNHEKCFKLILNILILIRSNECDVVRGECTQTYVPYLFLVIPLGPVTLTGQDYVLVESGCVCKPKGSKATAHELVSTMPAMPRP